MALYNYIQTLQFLTLQHTTELSRVVAPWPQPLFGTLEAPKGSINYPPKMLLQVFNSLMVGLAYIVTGSCRPTVKYLTIRKSVQHHLGDVLLILLYRLILHHGLEECKELEDGGEQRLRRKDSWQLG